MKQMKNKTKKIMRNMRNKRRQRGGNECDNIVDEDEREVCNEKYYKNFVKEKSPQVIEFIDKKIEKKKNQNTKAGKKTKRTAKKMRS